MHVLQRYSMEHTPSPTGPLVRYDDVAAFVKENCEEREKIIGLLQKTEKDLREYQARCIAMFYLLPGNTLCSEVQALTESYKAWRASVEAKPRQTTPDGYRVEQDSSTGNCAHCEQECPMWTIVEGPADDTVGIGQSWGNREIATDICELMNIALVRGREIEVSADKPS